MSPGADAPDNPSSRNRTRRIARRNSVRVVATEFDPDQVVREVTSALRTKFPQKDPAEVERVVRAEVDDLKDRPVHDYVSVLAQRAAKKQLNAS